MRQVNKLMATGIALAGLASASMAFASTADNDRTDQSAASSADRGQMMQGGGMMPQMQEMMAKCNRMMMAHTKSDQSR